MNHVLKIDERAFNEGVKEVLKLRPLVRVIKSAVAQKNKETQATSGKNIVRRKP